MSSSTNGDLGFSFRTRKNGDVQLLHRGALVTTLRGAAAAEFLAAMDGCEHAARQQIMARLTGNYKHGNERRAAAHPRNGN